MDLRFLLIALVGFPLLFITWIVAARAWRSIQQVCKTLGWLRIPGIIIFSGVRETTLTLRRNIGIKQERESLRYFAHVVYEYHVAGKRYENDRIRQGAVVLTSELDPAAKAVVQYPVGGSVTVYANPANPDEAVLNPHIGWATLIDVLLALVLLFVIVTVIAIFASLPPIPS